MTQPSSSSGEVAGKEKGDRGERPVNPIESGSDIRTKETRVEDRFSHISIGREIG